jgi:phosphoribosylformimino-5-aminoimidazole carboxamide ribotide isomerase
MTQIFPAIDIINGSCVRLTEGAEDSKKDYGISPLEMALQYEDAGAEYLHIVDLDAAFGNGNNYNIVSKIAQKTALKIQLGGGIRTTDQAEKIFNLGVSQIIIGSTAIKKPDLVCRWLEDFGPEKIVIGADTIEGRIAINGWKELSKKSLTDFITEFHRASAQKFLCTDISKDGKLGGSAIELYKKLKEEFPRAQFLASGGVTTLEEIEELKSMNIYGIIVGKAIYEGRIELSKLFQK